MSALWIRKGTYRAVSLRHFIPPEIFTEAGIETSYGQMASDAGGEMTAEFPRPCRLARVDIRIQWPGLS